MLLVVDDESLIRDWLQGELAKAGFKVATAPDGDQAIAALKTGAARFRGVITDINLQTRPDGWLVGRLARELVPAMGVVYMTDDSGLAWPSRGVPGSVILTKPFASAQLVTAISALLTEADVRRASRVAS